MFMLSVDLNKKRLADIPFIPPGNVFKLLAMSERTQVRSACQGKGTCGLCLVRIDQGAASELTQYEHQRLSEAQIA